MGFERDPGLVAGAFADPTEAHAAVLDALTEAIVVFDPEGVVRMANRPARELFGDPDGGLVGLNILDPRYPARDELGEPLAPEDYPIFRALRARRPVLDVLLGSQREDGTPLWLSVSATPLLPPEADANADAEEPYAVVASMKDITRYKEAERELARSHSELSRFAAVAAHDLSAPFTVIAGMADHLLRRDDETLDPDARELLTRIAAASRSGQNLIRELLDEGYPATAIGLAVCRRVVTRHGGRIWVDSAPGKGATFRFTLPAWDGGER